MLMTDNRCTYQILQKDFNIVSAVIHKIIHEELHTKKVVCHWVPHNQTEQQKVERVRISKETLQLLNDNGHHIISKIVTSDETYIPFFDVPTRQESKVWVFEDDPTPTMVKRQLAMEKAMHAIFSNFSWSKPSRLTVQFLRQKQVKVIEHLPHSMDLAMCDFWFFNLKKNLFGRRFHSKEDNDVSIKTFVHKFQQMNGLRHLISGKFVYKSALMLEKTILNTLKIF
ncbi:UNVERIFIED_CONTAM: hypothetical protein NCL1_24807 [Trichonephila clavipes]